MLRVGIACHSTVILTLPLKSRIDPPGVGSNVPAPSLENTSPSSREILRR